VIFERSSQKKSTGLSGDQQDSAESQGSEAAAAAV
jgi:hypothetical protein